MRGPFPARSRARFLRAVVVAAAAVSPALLGGCTDANGTRYTSSDPLATGQAAARAREFADRARAMSTGSERPQWAPAAAPQTRAVAVDDVSGVIGGSNGGARRAGTATVVVRADPSTCWILVVDGNEHRGCGNASITDTRGERAGRLIKLSGATPARVGLVSAGTTVDSGQVATDNHYVTVRG